MIFNVDGRECRFTNFDEYCSRFDTLVLPEYKGEAEKFFLEAVEGLTYEKDMYFEFFLPLEITKDNAKVFFVIGFLESEEDFIVELVNDLIEKLHHCIRYNLMGYDTYAEDFRNEALSECAGEAESILFRELEKIDSDEWEYNVDLNIILEAEKTKRKKAVCFRFDCYGCKDHVVEYWSCHEE